MLALRVFMTDLQNLSVFKGTEYKSHELSNWLPVCSITTS